MTTQDTTIGTTLQAVGAGAAEVHVTGRRIGATLIDFLVFALVGAAMAYFFGTISVHGALGFEVHLGGVAWAIWTVLIALYYVLMEGYLGQTLGKMALGIKVVGEGLFYEVRGVLKHGLCCTS